MSETCNPVSPAQPSLSTAALAALRKRWFYPMPAVFLTYSLAYLDRANYGFRAAAGLARTLHITDKQTSLLGSLFFLVTLHFSCRAPSLLASVA